LSAANVEEEVMTLLVYCFCSSLILEEAQSRFPSAFFSLSTPTVTSIISARKSPRSLMLGKALTYFWRVDEITSVAEAMRAMDFLFTSSTLSGPCLSILLTLRNALSSISSAVRMVGTRFLRFCTVRHKVEVVYKTWLPP